jgi:WD40 repeat protein
MERNTPFFKPGGTMDPSAPSYLERAADDQLLEALLAGEYVSVLDSRQKGKSSLIARTIVKLHTHGVQTVKLDLQRIGANVSAEQWYAGLLAGLGTELNLTEELFAFWESHRAVGPLARWISAISEVVLAKNPGQVVIFVDEVDFVRALSFPTDEFFAGIRDCYNRRSEARGFERLTFCLVGVATPGQLIRNPEITPFNIGTKVELSDFTLSETAPFALALNNWGRNGELLNQRVHYWVNGHPYLTQLLCSHISVKPEIKATANVDALVKELFFTPESRHREPNFADVERRILDPDVPGMSPEERKTQVLDLYGRLLRGKGVEASEENPVVVSLRLAGVGNEDHGSLRVRNRVYKTVFDEGWRRQSLPNAELRRQRGAARLAILRTAAVAGVVVLAISSAAVGILKISKEREKALITLGKTTKDLSRVSSDRKVALTDLEKRNLELKRISNEREEALASLGKSNEDLKLTSEGRQSALATLKQKSREISQLSNERKDTIALLNSTREARDRQHYDVVMGGINIGLTTGRADLVLRPASEIHASKFGNWELGYLNQLLAPPEYELKLPEFCEFEADDDGNLMVGNETGLYELKDRKLVQRMTFTIPPNIHTSLAYPYNPARRRGNFRFWSDRILGTEALHEVNSSRVLIPARRGISLHDVDPRGELYLCSPLPGGGTSDTIQLRTIEDDRFVAAPADTGRLGSASFLPNGNWLLVTSDSKGNSEIRLLDRSANTLKKAAIFADNLFNGKVYTNRTGALCAVNVYEKVEIRNTDDLSLVSKMAVRPTGLDWMLPVAFSHDSSLVATGTRDGTIRVFDVKTGDLQSTIFASRGSVHQLRFLRDGKHVASYDGFNLKVWPVEAPGPIQEVKDAPAVTAQLRVNGKEMISWTRSGTILNRNLVTGKTIRREIGPGIIGFDGRGKYIIVGKPDGTMLSLDASTLKDHRSNKPFAEKGDASPKLILADCSRYLAYWEDPAEAAKYRADQEAREKTKLNIKVDMTPPTLTREFAMLDAETLKVVGRYSTPYWRGAPIYSSKRRLEYFAYPEPDTSMINFLSTHDGKKIRRIDLGKKIAYVDLSPTEELMAVVHAKEFKSLDCEVALYSVEGKKIATLPYTGDLVTTIKFSIQGKYLAGINRSGECFLWNVSTGKLIAKLADNVQIREMAFSHDDERIVTQGEHGPTLTVWNARSGAELMTVNIPEGAAIPNAGPSRPYFSYDGKDIVCMGKDGVFRIIHSQRWKDQPKTARK